MTSFDDEILRVRVNADDADLLTVVAEGELDIAGDERLRVAIADAAITGKRVVLDLRGITFCGSSGIALILDAQRALGQRLRLLAGHEIRRVLELTGLTRLLDGGGTPAQGAGPRGGAGPHAEDREQAV